MVARGEGYSDAEHEAIGLCVALEAIDEIANLALLDLFVHDGIGEATVLFKTHVHQQLFLVRLLDFTTESRDRALIGVRGSCLDALQAVCDGRRLGHSDDIGGLARAVDALRTWLSTETKLNLWIPTLDLDTHLTVSRNDLLEIAGNHVKHNLAHLTRVSKRLAELLQRCGYDVEIESIPLALEDFREHLEEDYFNYYGTWLVALVNDLRWGIQDYLSPVFQSAYVKSPSGPEYAYEYPPSIDNELAREWFWRLMNDVRSHPILPRFTAPANLQWEHLHSPPGKGAD